MTPTTIVDWDEPRKIGEDYEINIYVDHIDYDRIGSENLISDLIVICRSCHYKIHDFVERLYHAGRPRAYTMKRLKPYCVRRINRTHTFYSADNVTA